MSELCVVSSYEDEEPVTASKLEESQSTGLDDNLHQKQSSYSDELDPSPAIDAMLSSLLPGYFAFQQTDFNSTREKILPSTSSTLGSRMDVDQSESHNSQAGFISTRKKTTPSIPNSPPNEPSSTFGSRMDVDQSESNSQASLDTTRVGATSAEGVGSELPGRGISNPSSKPKRSYKELVNQMLNPK
jgi:hypothetical protein